MIWENGIKTCIISYKKRIASPGSMRDTGSLGLVHWDDPEGWYGEAGGIFFASVETLDKVKTEVPRLSESGAPSYQWPVLPSPGGHSI